MSKDKRKEQPESNLIINGGDPIKDCPNNWEEAVEWETKANQGLRVNDQLYPVWRWDCGYKLDCDGGIISVTSRFYPPKTERSDIWDGKLKIYALGELIRERQFSCDTLEELKSEVDDYIHGLVDEISDTLQDE